jgi:hypothetical protein
MVAMGLTGWLYYEQSKPPSRPSLKKQLIDAEKINAELRAELERLKREIAEEQIRRRAIISPLKVSYDQGCMIFQVMWAESDQCNTKS